MEYTLSATGCDEFCRKVSNETPTFLHVLEKWSNEKPDQVALVWYEEGKPTLSITFRQLWTSIVLHAVEIEKTIQPGQCVLLLFEMGLQFIVHFYACLRVGVIAVPCYPPMPGKEQRGIEVITKVLKNSGARAILMSSKLEMFKKLRGTWPTTINNEPLQYKNLHLKLFSNLHPVPKNYNHELIIINAPYPSPQDIAFLQYTSGSTGDPKGVIIGQDTFLNQLVVASYWGATTTTDHLICTSWLPMYHDMGLCIGISTPLVSGGESHLMSPFDFLRDPLLWLDVVSTSKTTHTVVPNFAFGLVTRKWDSRRAKRWDFSALKMIGNSAEPIVRSTIENFAALMKKDAPGFHCGLQMVGYGLAENVASVGHSIYPEAPIYSKIDADKVASIPYCKERHPGVHIVSLTTLRECADGEEGEIWLQTPSTARGYWMQPELTKDAFENKLEGYEGYWLRSGDLGYYEDGHLFVSGRLKDVVIINGRNYYPQDIELAVQEAHEAIRPGCVAAFSIQSDDTEGVVVVAEIRNKFVKQHQAPALLKEVIGAIQSHVRSLLARECQQIVLLHERTIPKTTSGKIRRKETKLRWQENRLQEILRYPKTSTSSPAVDYNLELQWIRELISLSCKVDISQVKVDQNSSISLLEDRCKKFCIRYGISKRDVALCAQGLDSIKVAALSKDIESYIPVGVQLDATAFYEWTGKELVLALCGIVPERDLAVIHPTPLQGDDSDIPTMDTQQLHSSYSTLFRLCCELIGLSMMFMTIIASFVPAVHFFQASKSWDSPKGYWDVDPVKSSDDVYWISTGALMILFAPIFFISFTSLVILQKWLLWGRFQEGFIPMHSPKYYLWWYVDSLLAMWEILVFPFIADTILVNLVYWMLGGQNISLFASISTPIRNPELVSVGPYSTIDGYLYPYLVVPHGVGFHSIHVGEKCKVRSMSVVHRGSVIENNCCIDPCTVVVSFSHCEGSYRWAGNTCRREESWQAGENPPFINWLLETSWRLVLVGGLVWGSMIGMAISVRFWFLIFPSQPPSQRIGNFWINVWTYYGTGFFWSILTLGSKWFIFGKATAGPYHPTLMTNMLRWMVAYWNNIAVRLVWVHFTHSSLNIWSLLLGAKVDMSSQSGWFGCHPVDADLMEIHAHARVARNYIFTPYSADRKERGSIIIKEAAEVGLNCVLDASTTLEAGARVGVGIYLPPTSIVPSHHLLLNQHMHSFTSPTLVEGEEVLRLPIHSDWWYIFNFLSDGTAILAAWMHVWFAYFLYRSISDFADSKWWVQFVVMWIYVAVSMVMITLLNRLFPVLYNASASTWDMRRLCFCLWRWIVQYRRMHFDGIGRIIGGTLLYNLMMNLSGAKVAWSAKLFSMIMPDLSYYSIGEMVVHAERCFAFGHLLNNGQLLYGLSVCESYSCLYPHAMIFAGGHVKKETFIPSQIAVASTLEIGKNKAKSDPFNHDDKLEIV